MRQKRSAWEPPFEWEQYPLPDGSGYYQRRLVLKPNGRTSPPTSEYTGRDYWDERAWRKIEIIFAANAPDPNLRERVRQPVFSFLYDVTPAGRTRLVIDGGRVDEEWSAPESDRPLHARGKEVRKHITAVAAGARAVLELVSLLVPNGCTPLERGERERALSSMLNAIGPGPAQNLRPGSLFPIANDVRFANDFCNRVIPALEAVAPALQTLADAAPRAMAEIPSGRPGPKGDAERFRVLVRNLAELYAERRGRWPTVYQDPVTADYVGDLFDLFELIVPSLPAIPATFTGTRTPGARGQRIRRALEAIEASPRLRKTVA